MLLKQLEKWLARPGNTKAKLAAILGYSSSETISRWLERGRVPVHQQLRVTSILKGQKNVSSKQGH